MEALYLLLREVKTYEQRWKLLNLRLPKFGQPSPNLAAKIVDAIDTNLIAMTEPEILAMARDWFDSHSRV